MRLIDRKLFGMTALLMLLIAGGLDAQPDGAARPMSINLTEPDGFAERSIVVLRSGGEPLPGVRTIETFDRETGTFTFVDARGGTTRLQAVQIQAIEFRQEIARQNPAAQEVAWNITTQYGAKATLEIRPQDLHIKDGTLIVNAPPSPLTTMPGELVEAVRLSYLPQRELFSLELQAVKYQKNYLGGGGGSSGSRKGLQ
jgi:hypothetical protein